MGREWLATAGTLAGGVAGAIFFLWPAAIWMSTKNLEKPVYKVIKPLTDKKSWLHSGWVAEVRQYESYIVAEVSPQDGAGDIDGALRSGFRQIASYIFGNNEKRGGGGAAEKVAMTAPVALEGAGGGGGASASEKVAMTAPVAAELDENGGAAGARVWFMMPRKYTLETLPAPRNDAVSFREVPPRTLAAITFCGASPREAKVAAKRTELEELLRAAGLRAAGPVRLWQYHPPFTPFWQRRNEVLLEVQGDLGGAPTAAAAQ